MRLGFRQIKGMRQADVERILRARETHGPFTSVDDLHRRVGLDVSAVHRLAEADALASLGLTRRQAAWNAKVLSNAPAPLLAETNQAVVQAQLPLMPLREEVLADYASAGLSLKSHPVSFARAALDKFKVVPTITLQDADRLKHGDRVKVAGLVLVRQRPGTASGVLFITLEDETGVANLILWPQVYERYRRASRYATLLQADGVIQREGQVIHVLAQRLFDRTPVLRGLSQPSRDFH